jgi:hypothetical protein
MNALLDFYLTILKADYGRLAGYCEHWYYFIGLILYVWFFMMKWIIITLPIWGPVKLMLRPVNVKLNPIFKKN